MAKVKISWIASIAAILCLLTFGTLYNFFMLRLTIGSQETANFPQFVVERYLVRDNSIQKFQKQDLEDGDMAVVHLFSLTDGTFYQAWLNSEGPRGSYTELVLKHRNIKPGQVHQVSERVTDREKGYQLAFLFCSGKDALSPFRLEKGFKEGLGNCQRIPFH